MKITHTSVHMPRSGKMLVRTTITIESAAVPLKDFEPNKTWCGASNLSKIRHNLSLTNASYNTHGQADASQDL